VDGAPWGEAVPLFSFPKGRFMSVVSLSPASPKPLLSIDECPDLMADACVGDEDGRLIFLSVWARDTAVQEFLARLTLARVARGTEAFHVVNDAGAAFRHDVGNAARLEKRLTRSYRRTLFGSLVNLWLFDARCIRPDPANACALALLPLEASCRWDRLWRLTRETCPLPLLDPWREPVLEILRERSMLTRLPLALGPLEGYRLAIDVPVLSEALGELIRADVLTVDAGETDSLRKAA
jgi:hypothetical protein